MSYGLRIALWAGGLGTVLAFCLVLGFGLFLWSVPHAGSFAVHVGSLIFPDVRPFSARAWQDKCLVRTGMRVKMVDDLLKTHKIRGTTEKQVEVLLGPPDDTRYFMHADMVYWLGPERRIFQIDSEWLLVFLNEWNEVTRVEIVTD